MSMERRTRILIEIVIVTLVFSILLTYLRTIVLKDFYIVTSEEAAAEDAAQE